MTISWAKALLNALVREVPERADAWLLLGRTLLEEAEARQAYEALSHVLLLNPGNPEAFYLRGLARLQLDQQEAALQDLKAASVLHHEAASQVLRELEQKGK